MSEETKRCQFCGCPEVMEVGDAWVCEACYAQAGSCCREFGAEDLWKEEGTKRGTQNAERGKAETPPEP